MVNGLATALIVSCLALVQAASVDVDVGKNGLSFSPDTVTAGPNDKIHFHFYPGNHAVVEGDPDNACQPDGRKAFYSGFFTPSSGVDKKMFTVTFNSSDEVFVYCPQDSHCKFGMAMVINPSSNSALSSFKQAASSAPSSGHPKKVQGGKISKNKGS